MDLRGEPRSDFWKILAANRGMLHLRRSWTATLAANRGHIFAANRGLIGRQPEAIFGLADTPTVSESRRNDLAKDHRKTSRTSPGRARMLTVIRINTTLHDQAVLPAMLNRGPL